MLKGALIFAAGAVAGYVFYDALSNAFAKAFPKAGVSSSVQKQIAVAVQNAGVRTMTMQAQPMKDYYGGTVIAGWRR